MNWLNCVFVDRVPYLCLAKTFEAIEKVSARSVGERRVIRCVSCSMCFCSV